MIDAPPLAGLCSCQEGARTDGSVEDAARFLRRLARSDFYAGVREQST